MLKRPSGGDRHAGCQPAGRRFEPDLRSWRRRPLTDASHVSTRPAGRRLLPAACVLVLRAVPPPKQGTAEVRAAVTGPLRFDGDISGPGQNHERSPRTPITSAGMSLRLGSSPGWFTTRFLSDPDELTQTATGCPFPHNPVTRAVPDR